MSLLHAYFNLRNQQAFRRLLDNSHGSQAASSSGGKSWNRPSPLSSNTSTSIVDVNIRDSQGRTVLHLAASATDAAATEYIRMLLAHPAINVNLPDKESHWTALHRALYNGNVASALLLLQRQDIDTSLKDLEGYRPFDLYNSTVEGTKPSDEDRKRLELYTWGANRNAALGQGDGDDRTYPDHVVIERPDISEGNSLAERFEPVRVKNVAMAKLHTAVVTGESRNNLLLCGFGNSGRLGSVHHTQYNLLPVAGLPSTTILAVALGQDHTLALTSTGEIYSWGLNRLSQLGYVIESSTPGAKEEVQTVPRKVPGLRNKFIIGIAACRTASACWSNEEVWTWGTNSGQLGYDKAAQPVQISPRRVTKVSQPVLAVSITDTAMACLLQSHDVICLWNDGYFRINFPSQSFPSDISASRYRPPRAVPNTSIQKVTSCDNTFAALSTNGELFTFSLPAPNELTGKEKERGGALVKPQRVWALRKQFSAVKDVELGADGSIIICTESGHVFVRSRNLKSGPTSVSGSGISQTKNFSFKFQRVPYLQRTVQVFANNTGAFGAIRADPDPGRLDVVGCGGLIAEGLSRIQPYLRWDHEKLPSSVNTFSTSAESLPRSPDEDADEEDDDMIMKDIEEIGRLCDFLEKDKELRSLADGQSRSLFDPSTRLPHGADTMIQVRSGSEFPVHRVVLAARSPVLRQILSGESSINDSSFVIKLVPSRSSKPKISFSNYHPLSILILLFYLYCDDVLALWDRRYSAALEVKLASLKVKSAQVKLELQHLAKVLDLSHLTKALEAPVKRVPQPSMAKDIRRLFDEAQNIQLASSTKMNPIAADIVLMLKDKDVPCHSTILLSRSDFFSGFFGDDVWTKNRRTPDGVVKVDMKHMEWRVMKFVMAFLYGGDEDIFYKLEFIPSVDSLLEFMFEVMAAANELLLDRLVLICSSVILKRLTIANSCAVLTDAVHYNATQLFQATLHYITVNLETMLESRMLDDLAVDLIKQLATFIRQEQLAKSPTARSGKLVDEAMSKFKGWLDLQDIPEPIVRTSSSGLRSMGGTRDSAKLSPPGQMRKHKVSITSPENSPRIRPEIPTRQPKLSSGPGDDGVFMMDDGDMVPAIALSQSSSSKMRPTELPVPPSGRAPGWKVSSAPKVDMKSIMAEAETSRVMPPSRLPPTAITPSRTPSSGTAESSNWRTPQKSQTLGLNPENPIRAPSSPWRVPSISNLTASSHSPSRTPPATPLVQPTRPRDDISFPSIRREPPPTPPRAPGLGPVITPSKQTPTKDTSSPGARKKPTTGGSAWTLPPVQPIVQAFPAASAVSFIAIQQDQLEQGFTPVKDKRSLKEIQEEERARQVEEDFLRWWAAEEERTRLEQETLAVAQAASQAQRPKSKGKKKAKVDKPSAESSQAPSGESATTQGRSDQRPARPHFEKKKPQKTEGDGKAYKGADNRKPRSGGRERKPPQPQPQNVVS